MISDRTAGRTLRTAGWASLIGAVALAGTLALNGMVGAGPRERGGTTASHDGQTHPDELASTFRMASFNVLGAGHTDRGGNLNGWASGVQRMTWAVELINRQDLDVIGFQEFQDVQYERFKELQGDAWGIYPGDRFHTASMQNSIAWRRDTWQLVEARMIGIPYFAGNIIRMPHLLLKHRTTGRKAWFFNTHNPADARGPAQKWRDAGYQIEIKLVNELRAEFPGVPVFSTGDKNDRGDYFCPMVRNTELKAANGGGLDGDNCVPPDPAYVDWIMGTNEVSFTNYKALHTRLVRKITNHKVITSGVSIPPTSVVESPIKNVVLLNLEGLTSRALKRWADEDGLKLAQLRETGASTLNARTTYERTTNLPNVTAMLTGRRVNPDEGGHGVSWGSDPGTTVHAAAGEYVASAFDQAHDFGQRTSLFTTDQRLARLDTSWNAVNGAPDPHEGDNGRDKLSTYVMEARSGRLVDRLVAHIEESPTRLTVVNLSLLTEVGTEHGFASEEYRAALHRADRMVRRLLRAIGDSSMDGRTMTVITSSHGGSRQSFTPPTELANHRVPIIVTGPGVAAGANLYDLNPQYTKPGDDRPSPTDPQPIRLEDLANLITRHLGVPRVPGTTANGNQSLVVTPPDVPST